VSRKSRKNNSTNYRKIGDFAGDVSTCLGFMRTIDESKKYIMAKCTVQYTTEGIHSAQFIEAPPAIRDTQTLFGGIHQTSKTLYVSTALKVANRVGYCSIHEE